MSDPQGPATRAVTPLQTVLAGAAVLVAGAVLTGGAHYASTAKKLAEEGVAPAARLRALPLAAQALGASTVLCAAMGGAALAAWHFLGLETRGVAEVSSFTDAVVFAKQQRVSGAAGEGWECHIRARPLTTMIPCFCRIW